MIIAQSVSWLNHHNSVHRHHHHASKTDKAAHICFLSSYRDSAGRWVRRTCSSIHPSTRGKKEAHATVKNNTEILKRQPGSRVSRNSLLFLNFRFSSLGAHLLLIELERSWWNEIRFLRRNLRKRLVPYTSHLTKIVQRTNEQKWMLSFCPITDTDYSVYSDTKERYMHLAIIPEISQELFELGWFHSISWSVTIF